MMMKRIRNLYCESKTNFKAESCISPMFLALVKFCMYVCAVSHLGLFLLFQ